MATQSGLVVDYILLCLLLRPVVSLLPHTHARTTESGFETTLRSSPAAMRVAQTLTATLPLNWGALALSVEAPQAGTASDRSSRPIAGPELLASRKSRETGLPSKVRSRRVHKSEHKLVTLAPIKAKRTSSHRKKCQTTSTKTMTMTEMTTMTIQTSNFELL